MRTVRTIAEVRAHVARARHGSQAPRTIGLVPTMGAFHAGHVALMQAARESCDEVIVSLFVNPAQFDESTDLAAYPRAEAEDAAVAAEAGVDLLFAPDASEIYPAGFATTVAVGGLGEVLEGAERGPQHFAGVCTVVCKLFNIVAPDVAYFGQKDAQQVAVIKRMVRDLDLPVRIEVLPTVRDEDGLALSSRNARLAPDERERALGLHAALGVAEQHVRAGERDASVIQQAGLKTLQDFGVDPEYLALIHPETLAPVERINGRVLVAIAARVGATRLIDNALLETR